MIKRRDMLSALVATAVGTAVAPGWSLAATGSSKRPGRKLPWRNWSGSQHCIPDARKAPASVAELQELITSTTGVIRPVGAGHSFTPLVPTEGTIVSLSRISGVVSHDSDTAQATLWAGTRLGDIGQPLENVGQALQNMPDIDEQTLAGCLGTATHGTGSGIGCMSSFVQGLQLMDARGELISCSAQENSELFAAAKVSLGSLGILTQVTLQNEPSYQLRRETTWRSLEEIIEIADSEADKHRNFEFYYVPFSGMGFTDAHDYSSEPVGSTDKLDTNEGAQDLKTVRDMLEWSPGLRELILGSYMKTLNDEVTIENSWKNYASERNVRFNEMEYHLPREHGLQAFKEICDVLELQHPEVFFPIEVRYVHSDDIWLSPFFGRETMSIAVHRYFEEDFKPFFKTIEPIFRKYNGRPHWGKLNTLSGKELKALYPRWDDFTEVRRHMDPHGRFLNTYLQQLFAQGSPG